MKFTHLLVIMLLSPIVSFAQLTMYDIPLKKEISHVFYAGNSIEQKIKNTKTWIATTFGDYNAVVQFEDIATGRIIIKGKTPVEETLNTLEFGFKVRTATQYTFTIIFDNKEDRFRIKIEDIKYMSGTSMGVNASSPIPNEEMPSIEERIANVERNVDYIIKRHKDSMLKITNRLNQGVSKKKERESLMIEYKKQESKLKDLEERRDVDIKETRDKLIIEYKTIFLDILNSASSKIAENDDF